MNKQRYNFMNIKSITVLIYTATNFKRLKQNDLFVKLQDLTHCESYVNVLY